MVYILRVLLSVDQDDIVMTARSHDFRLTVQKATHAWRHHRNNNRKMVCNVKWNSFHFSTPGRRKTAHSRNNPCDTEAKVTRPLSYLLGAFSQAVRNLLIQLHAWTMFRKVTIPSHYLSSFPLWSTALILLPFIFRCWVSTSWDFNLFYSPFLLQVRQIESFIMKTNHDKVVVLHSKPEFCVDNHYTYFILHIWLTLLLSTKLSMNIC